MNLAAHGTLTANTVTQETLNNPGGVEVINRSGTAEIYFTVGPASRPPANPTVGGADCYVVPAAIMSYVVPGAESLQDGPLTVLLISAGTPNVSVIAIGATEL